MLDLEYTADAIVVRIRAVPGGVLTAGLLDSLAAAVRYVGPDRAIVLTGAGDLFAPDLDPAPGLLRTAAVHRLPLALAALRAHPLPIVAAINGDAVGAAYTLACAADVRIISGGVVQPLPQSTVRYHGPSAVAAGLVERCCAPADLLDVALRQICSLGPRAAMSG